MVIDKLDKTLPCFLFTLGVFITVQVGTSISTTTSNSLLGADKAEVFHFSCFTYNYDDYLRCTWELSDNSTVNITKIFKWRVVSTYWFSGWVENTILKENVFEIDLAAMTVDYERTINACVVIGNVSEDCHTIALPQIVKPAPVFNVITQKCSSCISISWNHNRHDRDLWQGQIYRVEYQSQWEPIVMRNVTDLKINLTGLIAYTTYQISISCKPENGGFWSDPVSIEVRTQKDVPSQPPETKPGSFVIENSAINNIFNLIVYWKGLEERYFCDRQISYRVNVYDESGLFSQGKDVNFATTVFSFTNNGSYVVRIWSLNSKGVSSNHSSIYVPAQENLLPAPYSVAFLTQGSRKVKITWDIGEEKSRKSSNITSLTVFWCPRASFIRCKDDLHWEVIRPIQNIEEASLIINKPAFVFGVSIQQNVYTSAIRWSSCVIREKKIPSTANVLFESRQDNSVLIRWSITGCYQSLIEEIIDKFIVQICTDNRCTEMEVNGTTTYIGRTVEPGVTICVRVAPVTMSGRGSYNYKQCFRQRVPHDSPSLLISITIALSVTLVVVTISTLIWKWFKYDKSIKNRPSIDTSFIKLSTDDRKDMPPMYLY